MPKDFKVTLTGDAELRRKLQNPEFVRGPVRQFLTKSAILLEQEVKDETPADTGRLRAAITHKVEPFRAIVGVKANSGASSYASHVEFGTKPHWPPLAALQPWAVRHGFPPGRAGAFLVARAIARRGTRARRMFQKGVTASRGRIMRMWQDVGGQVEARWKR